MRERLKRSVFAAAICCLIVEGCAGVSTPSETPRATAAVTPTPMFIPQPTAASVPGQIAACPLMTNAELEAAIGPTGHTVVRTTDIGGVCLYYGAEEYLARLSVVNDPRGLASLAPFLTDPANEQVPGIGDKATLYRSGRYSRSLAAVKGGKGFQIDLLTTMTDADAKTAMIALATLVAGRI